VPWWEPASLELVLVLLPVLLPVLVQVLVQVPAQAKLPWLVLAPHLLWARPLGLARVRAMSAPAWARPFWPLAQPRAWPTAGKTVPQSTAGALKGQK
jgi:hypothetical protein